VKNYLFIFVGFLTLVSFSLFNSGCKQAVSADVNIDVTGTLTLPFAASGKEFVVIFDNDDNPFNGYSRKASGTCGSGTAVQYSVSLGDARSYYVYAYVEIDNSFAQADMKYAGAGDYFGIYDSVFPAWPASANAVVSNSRGQVYDITLVTAAPNITGTLTLAASRTQPYYVIIDSDTNYANGFVSIASGSCFGASVSYNMFSPFPGTYYAYAVVDVDLDMNINYDSGDELGYFGSISPRIPQPAPGLLIPEGAPVAANITLEVNNSNTSVLLNLPSSAAGMDYLVWFSDTMELNVGKMSDFEFSGSCGAGTTVFMNGNTTPGEYYVFAFVDATDDGRMNTGDYFGVIGANYPDLPGSKSVSPGSFIMQLYGINNNVSGSVTGVTALTFTASAYIAAMTSYTDLNSVTAYNNAGVLGDFNYQMFVPFSGTYMVLAFINVTGGSMSQPGNLLGFAGSTLLPYLPPSSANISINHKVNNTVNIVVGEIPAI
jgi:hypothetical protein